MLRERLSRYKKRLYDDLRKDDTEDEQFSAEAFETLGWLVILILVLALLTVIVVILTWTVAGVR